MSKISAILLVGGDYNEKLYKKCLESVTFCDEVIKVPTKDIPGSFSEWRNWGADKARGDWLLYVDIDEEVTPELKKEILDSVESDEFSAYAFPRKNILLGKNLTRGGWYPDYVLRLIKKEKLKGWSGRLHEQPKVEGSISHLKNTLTHVSHRSISEMIKKTNQWSRPEAQLLFESGHPPMNIFRFFTAGFREFWKRGIILGGLLDGTIGAVEVFYQTFSRLVTYTKLWEMQINKK